MLREDISHRLIHFTKGESFENAYQIIRNIIHESRLIGSNGFIKGGYNCVCFSEAPLTALECGLLNSSAYSRYSPFGVVFDKKWIFEQGGRPAIYQTDAEYDALPDDFKWRHVRYDLSADEPIDFTWEREWRMLTNQLEFNPLVADIVLPDSSWANRLVAEHDSSQNFNVLQYSQIMDAELAEQYRESFDWRIFCLT